MKSSVWALSVYTLLLLSFCLDVKADTKENEDLSTVVNKTPLSVSNRVNTPRTEDSARGQAFASAIVRNSFISKRCLELPEQCYPTWRSASRRCGILLRRRCCCKVWRTRTRFCAKPCTCPPVCRSPPAGNRPQTAWVSGDPHLKTYDNLHYDCQGCGEFVLSRKEKCPKFELQARFYIRSSTATVSTVSDAVISHENSPTVQISYVRSLSTPHSVYTVYGTKCKVAVYIDGVNTPFGPLSTQQCGSTSVSSTSTSITVDLPSGMRVVFDMWVWAGRCVATVDHMMPPTMVHTGVVGLFGSPDSNSGNDFMLSDGTPIPTVPSDGTAHCNNNWRIEDASQSFFTYESGLSHSAIADCSAGDWNGFPVRMLTSSVPRISNLDLKKIKEICKGRADCMLDGRLGGVDGAEQFMAAMNRVQRDVKAFEGRFRNETRTPAVNIQK